MRLALVLLATLVLALPACGGDDGSGGGDDGDAVEPEAWAADVCGAVGTWLEDVQKRSDDIGPQAQEAGSLQEIKRQFVAFFDGLIERTDQMVSEFEAAGVPDVEEGEAIAADFRQSLEPLREALVEAREQAENLPTEDQQAFVQQVTEAGQTVERAGPDVQKAFDRIDTEYDSPELERAFDEDEACAKL